MTQPTPSDAAPNKTVALGDIFDKHAYALGVGAERHEGVITVYANSRAQAHGIAKRAGYHVRDVNMVG